MLQINEFQFENNIKILLKKIEKGICKEYNLNLLFLIYKGYTESIDTIIYIINGEFEKKQELLNQLAVFFYKAQEYEDALSLLNASYILSPQNNDTLYNLGYILFQMNENELSLEFLNKIEQKDSDIMQLIDEIRNKI